MSFHVIENSTGTLPFDVNDNFIWVAQGSIYPRGGEYLAATTSVYDIGEPTHIFNNGYFSGTISADTITANGSFIEIANLLLTAASSSLDIAGLNGDAHYNYFISIAPVSAIPNAQFLTMWFNGISTSSYYYYAWQFSGFTTSVSNVFTWYEQDINAKYVSHHQIKISAKTGENRRVQSYGGTHGFFGEMNTGIFIDSTTTITSIKFILSGGNFAEGTKLTVHKYGLA